MENILNSLQQASNEKISWFEETRNKQEVSDCRLYLTVVSDFRVYCKYALSDLENEKFQKLCNHQHTVVCDQCQRLAQVLIDMEQAIQTC